MHAEIYAEGKHSRRSTASQRRATATYPRM